MLEIPLKMPIEQPLPPDYGELTKQMRLLEKRLSETEGELAAIHLSEKRYRRLFEAAQDGILILNAETGRVVDANPFLLRLLGYPYPDICGKHIWDIGVFKDITASKAAFKTLQDNEYIRYDDLPLETVDGKAISVEFVSNVYLVDHQKVIQCNIRDITRNRLLKERFLQDRKMDAVGILAGGMAHDYNNMLSVIMGHAELALAKVDPSHPIHSDIAKIIKAALHSSEIIRQLMAFAGKQAVNPLILDMNSTIENMFQKLESVLGDTIDLRFRPCENICQVKMDPGQVEEILVKLCENARDAIHGTGRVTIETGKSIIKEGAGDGSPGVMPGEYVLISVSDNGCGMSKDVLEHIFEPFYAGNGLGMGTGLGLSTVYGVVKQNNGLISVDSEPGKGATFNILLHGFMGRAVEIPVKTGTDLPLGRGETILIVDDEPMLLTLNQKILEKLGYRVLTALLPGEAIALTKEHADTIHLVLTDVVMPEMNGLDLSERLLCLDPDIEILFMSGYTADVINPRGVLGEGVNFIQKPFTTMALAAKVRAILDNGHNTGRA